MVYGMGNYIKILAVVIVLVFAGCKDWLDVTPAGQATEVICLVRVTVIGLF